MANPVLQATLETLVNRTETLRQALGMPPGIPGEDDANFGEAMVKVHEIVRLANQRTI